MSKDTGSKGGLNCIDDFDVEKEKRFHMEGGGWVVFHIPNQTEWKEIRKKTVREKVDFKKVEGIPARLPYEETNKELQNELFWDYSIKDWGEFCFKHPTSKETIICTTETCTKENKLLLINSKKFVTFANESMEILTKDEAEQEKALEKN